MSSILPGEKEAAELTEVFSGSHSFKKLQIWCGPPTLKVYLTHLIHLVGSFPRTSRGGRHAMFTCYGLLGLVSSHRMRDIDLR